MTKKVLLFTLTILLSAFGTCFASGTTTTVTGMTAFTTPAYNDLLIAVDVSDTTQSVNGSTRKMEIQYLPKGFPSGSISGATLDPDIFGPGAISGATLDPSILGANAISGDTIAEVVRLESQHFLITDPVTGSSVFFINQLSGVSLVGISLVANPIQPVDSGVTIQVYRGNARYPSISAEDTILSYSGANNYASGSTAFHTYTGETTFQLNDIIVAYVSATSGNTISQLAIAIKMEKYTP